MNHKELLADQMKNIAENFNPSFFDMGFARRRNTRGGFRPEGSPAPEENKLPPGESHDPS